MSLHGSNLLIQALLSGRQDPSQMLLFPRCAFMDFYNPIPPNKTQDHHFSTCFHISIVTLASGNIQELASLHF